MGIIIRFNLQDYIRGVRRRGVIAKCWGLENLWWLPFGDTSVLISTLSVSVVKLVHADPEKFIFS